MEQFKKQLESFKKSLATYDTFFRADGTISVEEQKLLDKMTAIIKKCETKIKVLEKEKNKQKGSSNNKDKWIENIWMLINDKNATLDDLIRGNKKKGIPSMGTRAGVLKSFPHLAPDWEETVIKYIKGGGTLASLEKDVWKGSKKVILKKFPQLDPNWKPKVKDVNKYLLHPQIQKQIINEINTQLAKNDNKIKIKDTFSKHMGSALGADLGYFNLKFNIKIKKIRFSEFSGNSFKGTISFTFSIVVPDGIFFGAGTTFNANVDFASRYKINIAGENISLSFYPLKISLNTSKFNVFGGVVLTSVLASVFGLFGAAYLQYKLKFYVTNNILKVSLGKVLGIKLPTYSVYTITPIEYITSAFDKSVDISIPKEKIRINSAIVSSIKDNITVS
jgi:hypothetical protein